MSVFIGKVTYNGEDFIIDIDDKKVVKETFWEQLSKNESLTFPSELTIDLLILSQFIYYCDRHFKRETALDGWKREFVIEVPMINNQLYEKMTPRFRSMLNFLTGDDWEISFVKRELSNKEIKLKEKLSSREKKDFTQVCMFSGGLDSFIGAVDILEKNNGETLFVSHYGGGKGTLEYQDILIERIKETYKQCSTEQFFQFYLAAQNGEEDTTRSRSFMFFSHAIALASSVSANKLIIPENGFISLNVPLDYARNGSSSTRTTHPFYFEMLQDTLDDLGLKLTIDNPYQFKTKGEMILESLNEKFIKNNLINTMSCSHPDQGRWSGLSTPTHCGYCIPCSIRRASIFNAFGNDGTRYVFKKYDSPEAIKNLNAIKVSIAKNMSKNPLFVIQQSGQITENIKEYAETYLRGLKELENFIGSEVS